MKKGMISRETCGQNPGGVTRPAPSEMGRTGTGSVHLHFEVRTPAGMGYKGLKPYLPLGSNAWWANSSKELHENWVDISSLFGGYGESIPEDWH